MNVTCLDDLDEVVAAHAPSGMSDDELSIICTRQLAPVQVGTKGSLWTAAICQRPAFALALPLVLALAEAVLSGGAEVARPVSRAAAAVRMRLISLRN